MIKRIAARVSTEMKAAIIMEAISSNVKCRAYTSDKKYPDICFEDGELHNYLFDDDEHPCGIVSDIEFIKEMREYVKKRGEVIMIEDDVVEFLEEGSIKVGCTTISWGKLSKIYSKALEHR